MVSDQEQPVTETITIPVAEHKRLLHADRVLNALYASGVDDWEWFGDAMDLLGADEEEVI